MITRDQMMPLLIEACPSYREVSQQMPEEDLFYTALGNFADYLLELHQQHHTESFTAVGRERVSPRKVTKRS